MMFRRIHARLARAGQWLLIGAAGLALAVTPAMAGKRYAVVPTATIYPGETIGASKLDQVEVTNPNLLGGYVADPKDAIGMVSTRTLLPGRTIPVAVLKRPFDVTRGAQLRLIFTIGNLTISAAGSPMDDANIGDVIRVRNLDSGQIVSGTVMANGTVQVMAK